MRERRAPGEAPGETRFALGLSLSLLSLLLSLPTFFSPPIFQNFTHSTLKLQDLFLTFADSINGRGGVNVSVGGSGGSGWMDSSGGWRDSSGGWVDEITVSFGISSGNESDDDDN